jgi:hypothetical protein
MSTVVIIRPPAEKVVVTQTATRTVHVKTAGPRGPEGPAGPGVLVLDIGEPIPEGTPPGTVILRRD